MGAQSSASSRPPGPILLRTKLSPPPGSKGSAFPANRRLGRVGQPLDAQVPSCQRLVLQKTAWVRTASMNRSLLRSCRGGP